MACVVKLFPHSGNHGAKKVLETIISMGAASTSVHAGDLGLKVSFRDKSCFGLF